MGLYSLHVRSLMGSKSETHSNSSVELGLYYKYVHSLMGLNSETHSSSLVELGLYSYMLIL